jgi:cobalt-zinc-cadmium efflux system outer membrane protein
MRLIATALAVTFFSCMAQAQAQTAPPGGAREVTTLDQALALAGLSSPNVEAAEAGVTAAEQGRTVAGLRPNPSVSVEVENVAGTGPYRGIGESETTVGFAMPLELGGKRTARLGVANAQLDRARLESAVTIADLRLRVT